MWWYLPPRLAAGTSRVAVAASAAAVAATTTAVAAATITRSGGCATEASASVARVGGCAAEAATTSTAAAVLAEIGVAATTATTTTTSTTATGASAAIGGLASNGLKESGNLLIGLLEKIDELSNDGSVTAVEEGRGNTGVSSTAGTTDTMDVVVNIRGQIVVDNVGDIGNIQATSGNSSGHENRADTVSELLQGLLTLALSAVTVNGVGAHVLVDEEIRERVCHALRLNEDECETAVTVSVKDVEEHRALVNVLDVFNSLSDVLGGRADTADRQEDVVLQEILGKHLDVAREGGRKHERLAALSTGHILALNDAANLGLETHVKHAISLIKNQILDVAQRDATTLDEIDKSAGGGDEEIAAAFDLAKLRSDLGTTIDNARADPRAVGELARLVVNLRDKFAGRGKDQCGGVRLALATIAAALAGRNGGRTMGEGLRQNGEQETTRLA